MLNFELGYLIICAPSDVLPIPGIYDCAVYDAHAGPHDGNNQVGGTNPGLAA